MGISSSRHGLAPLEQEFDCCSFRPLLCYCREGMRRRRRRNADSVMEIHHVELKGVRKVDVVEVCEGVWKDDTRMA